MDVSTAAQACQSQWLILPPQVLPLLFSVSGLHACASLAAVSRCHELFLKRPLQEQMQRACLVLSLRLCQRKLGAFADDKFAVSLASIIHARVLTLIEAAEAERYATLGESQYLECTYLGPQSMQVEPETGLLEVRYHVHSQRHSDECMKIEVYQCTCKVASSSVVGLRLLTTLPDVALYG
mmetsp:Transcript_78136/g.216999  ORF Transcript_78136/g.216999 Transcript_78136/m.216999 type:complete len:181 (+) Transcript_78136:110-652(+)